MPLIELHVSLAIEIEVAACQPEVRAWIDLRPELGLDTEIELPLSRRNRDRWVGAFAIPDSSPNYFFYRIGIVAAAGVVWTLVVRDRGRACTLFWDTDSLALAKSWLAGTGHVYREPMPLRSG